MKGRAFLAFSLVFFWGVVGCERKSGPSPEFERAHQAFSKLFAQKLDDAYLDPQMVAIEEDLQRVPPSSVDAEDARKLLARIEEGRSRMQKAAESRLAASESARKASDNFPPSTAFVPAPTDSDAGVAAAPDAGPPPQPTAGMARADFEKRFGACFSPGEPVDVQGRGLRETFLLKDITNCRERHPGYEKSLVIVEGTQVLAIVPKSALALTYPDGGRPVPDAGPPSPVDAGVSDGGTGP